MKQWVVALGTLAVLVAAGCGKKEARNPAPRAAEQAAPPADAAGPRKITVCWAQWAPADGLRELGQEFKKETGIGVDVMQIPWPDFQNQVFLDFAKKETPFDIVVGDSQWIGRGATEGLYVELTDWLKTSVDLSSYNARILRFICEYPRGSGKYFAAPCESDAMGFAYRKDWFEDAAEKQAYKAATGQELAPPTTWEEFEQIARFFTRPDKQRYGCVLITGRDYDDVTMGFQQLLYTFGGAWGDEKYTADGFVNAPASVEALKFFMSLMKYGPKGAESQGYGKALEAFLNNSTAMMMNYFAFFPAIQQNLGDKVGFFMMPRKGERRVISLGGQGFSISTKVSASQQDLAKKFIAWFLQKSVQEKWITKPAGFTAHDGILKTDAFRSATPYNAAFADSLQYLQDFWNVPAYNELLAAAQQYIGEALDGKTEPKAALDSIARAHERIFHEAGLR